MVKVLDGIKVLDFSRFAAGPICPSLLADMGADVIRVEKLGGDDDRTLGPFTPGGEPLLFMSCNRNKKGITLNLRTEKGKELLRKLVERTDVVVHNFSPRSEEARTLDYDKLKETNPAIIVVAVSAFGQYGPYSERPGFDTVGQAISGAMSFTGFPGDPPTRSGVAWVDYSTAVHAALGTMFALYHRQRTGQGQMVDMALLDSAVYAVAAIGAAADYKINGVVRWQMGNYSYYNFAGCFKAKDGWVLIYPIINALWRRFAKAIGREDLLDDPRCKDPESRWNHREFLSSVVNEWIADKSVEEVIKLLEKAHIPTGQVNTVAEMVTDPQVKAREMLVDVDSSDGIKVAVGGVPIKLSLTPGKVERGAPTLGGDNEEVYSGMLGLSSEELSHLEKEGII